MNKYLLLFLYVIIKIMIKIENKIYYITFNLCEDAIYVELFGIKPKYRGRKYSYRIFNNLKKKL